MPISPTPRRAEQADGASDFLLTPTAQAALFGFNALQTNLEIWRRVADSMRENMRAQQDAMLRLMLVRSTTSAVREGVEEAAETAANATLNGASNFMTPMVAARRAYVQMSGAMIDAQRQALQAFVGESRPH